MDVAEVPNKFGVDITGQSIQLLSPPRGPFSARDAFILAAYLVAAAEQTADPQQDGTFADWQHAVPRLAEKSAA